MQTEHLRNTKRNAHAGLVLSAVIVGFSFPAVGLITEGLPPLTLTAIRFAIAAVAVWPLIRSLPGRWPSLPGLALYSVLGTCLASFFGTMFWAAHHASALSMAAIYVSVPAIAYSLGRLLRVEEHSSRLISILLTGAMGALTLIWAESWNSGQAIKFGIGEAGFLLACIGAASYPVVSKYGLKRRWLSPRAELRTFWSLLAGSLIIGGIAMVTESPGDIASMTLMDATLITYLAVFSSAFTFWLSQRATAVLTPGAVTAYSYTAPFVAMLLMFISDPAQMGWRWLPGSVLVILSITFLFQMDGSQRQGRQLLVQRPTVSGSSNVTCKN